MRLDVLSKCVKFIYFILHILYRIVTRYCLTQVMRCYCIGVSVTSRHTACNWPLPSNQLLLVLPRYVKNYFIPGLINCAVGNCTATNNSLAQSARQIMHRKPRKYINHVRFIYLGCVANRREQKVSKFSLTCHRIR